MPRTAVGYLGHTTGVRVDGTGGAAEWYVVWAWDTCPARVPCTRTKISMTFP